MFTKVKYKLQSFYLEPSPSDSAVILLSECMKKQDGWLPLPQSEFDKCHDKHDQIGCHHQYMDRYASFC